MKLSAQELPKKPKTISSSDWAGFVEKDKHFIYDSLQIFKYLDSQWVCTEKRYFKYNKAHQVVETIKMLKVADSLTIDTKEYLSYDSVTHKLAERNLYSFLMHPGTKDVFKEVNNYKYDEKGNTVLSTKTDYINYGQVDPANWINLSGDSVIYKYNADGVPMGKDIYEGIRNEVWALKERLLVDSLDTKKQPSEFHISLFLKGGKETEARRYRGIKWFKSPKSLNDPAMYVSEIVKQVPGSGSWVDSWKMMVYHNSTDSIDSLVRYINKDGALIPGTKQVFHYGRHYCKDSLNYEYSKANGGQWQLVKGHKEVARYDADKLIFEVTVMETKGGQVMASKKDNWVAIEKRIYY